MAYIVVAIVGFLIGYVLCFKHFRDDITQGKLIKFGDSVYVASKRQLEK